MKVYSFEVSTYSGIILYLWSSCLVPIMLKSAEGLDQMTTFLALTMRRKMEIARERQGRSIVTTTQHPMPDLAILPPFLLSATQQRDPRQGGAVSVGPIWHACITIRPAKHRLWPSCCCNNSQIDNYQQNHFLWSNAQFLRGTKLYVCFFITSYNYSFIVE